MQHLLHILDQLVGILDFTIKGNNLVCRVNQATRVTNRYCSLLFITSQHPYFNVGLFELSDGLLDLILQFVLNRSHCYKVHLSLNLSL